MARLTRSWLVIVAVAAALAGWLGAAGCAGSALAGRPVGGSADLLATPGGVVWSFSATELSNGVLRSTDSGRHWKVVLSPYTVPGDLTASYFLGPDRAWVTNQQRHAFGLGETTIVLGTSDGGRTWWRSRPLPGDVTACCGDLADQVYFADARRGWLLVSGTLSRPGARIGGASQVMRLWRTSDGGRNWLPLPTGPLPLQGTAWGSRVPPECGSDPPQVAFASARLGWLTEGACGLGAARPLAWRTGDGGLHWTPAALPAPHGGWGDWLGSSASEQGGVSVGPPMVAVSGAGRTVVLVPVTTVSALVIEKSANDGRIWQVASRVHDALESDSEPRDWFSVIDARHWVLSGPAELIETSNAGHTWRTAGYPSGAPGSPASFLSLRRGFVRSYGGLVARVTSNGGRTWARLPAPAGWHGASVDTLGPAITSVQVVSARFAVASGAAGVLVSRDGGWTWQRLPAITVPVYRAQFLSPTDGFAITPSGKLLRTADGGMTWHLARQPGGQPAFSAQFWSPTRGAASTAAGLYITGDGGATWRLLAEPAGWKAHGPFCFAQGGAGWQVASQHGRPGVLVTADAGASWQVALPPGLGRSNDFSSPSIVGCSGISAWVLYTALVPPICGGACGNTYPRTYDLLRTADLGRTWLDVLKNPDWSHRGGLRPAIPASAGALQPKLFNREQSVDFEPLALTAGGTVWVTTQGPNGGLGIARSADGGLTWTARNYQLTTGTTSALPPPVLRGLPGDQGWLATTALDSQRAWVLTRSFGDGTTYLYATTNGGATWIQIATFG
jgi:photosystem II stability/assembly factor-like uncharacterized protein